MSLDSRLHGAQVDALQVLCGRRVHQGLSLHLHSRSLPSASIAVKQHARACMLPPAHAAAERCHEQQQGLPQAVALSSGRPCCNICICSPPRMHMGVPNQPVAFAIYRHSAPFGSRRHAARHAIWHSTKRRRREPPRAASTCGFQYFTLDQHPPPVSSAAVAAD